MTCNLPNASWLDGESEPQSLLGHSQQCSGMQVIPRYSTKSLCIYFFHFQHKISAGISPKIAAGEDKRKQGIERKGYSGGGRGGEGTDGRVVEMRWRRPRRLSSLFEMTGGPVSLAGCKTE